MTSRTAKLRKKGIYQTACLACAGHIADVFRRFAAKKTVIERLKRVKSGGDVDFKLTITLILSSCNILTLGLVCWALLILIHQHHAFDGQDMLENITFVDRETPLSLLEKQDAGDLLRQLVAQLPKEYQLVVALYHWEEMSYKEITEITGMPEGTVKSYLFRARNLLKMALEKATVDNRH